MAGKIKVNEMVRAIKLIHQDCVCLFKIGTFVHCYNRDAYIISYLLGYQIRNIENNGKECGFPIGALNKIMAKLEDKKINYAIFDRRNNYEEEELCNFKEFNQYNRCFEKAKEYINCRIRIEKINNFLLDNIEKEDIKKILGRIENEICEGRKI